MLVTGGGGFLGKAIVKKLVERGDRVRSFSRRFYPELDAMGVEQFQGDIRDLDDVMAACRDVEVVFHVAAKSGVWGDYSEYYNTNVIGTENVINACRYRGTPKLVYTSTPSAVINGGDLEGVNESVPYPARFHSHYSRTKALAEQAVVRATAGNLKTIILRPHVIWGPGDKHLVPRIIERAHRMVRIGNGKNRIHTIYVDNAADAHLLAAERLEENPLLSGKIYFICQDDPILLWEWIDDILSASGSKPVRRAVPPWPAFAFASLLEFFHHVFRLRGEPLVTKYVVHELSTAHWFDIGAARRDLGFVPTISMEEGKKHLIKWISEEYSGKRISA